MPSPPPAPRLLAISSGGGHWTELERCSPAFTSYDALYVSTGDGLVAPSGVRPVVRIPDGSRSSPVRLLAVAFSLGRLIARFRPRIIVSTGAAPGLIAIVIGKLFGCRAVWIDSIANAERLSLSGRLAKRWCDARLTQWPHLSDRRNKVDHIGSVI